MKEQKQEQEPEPVKETSNRVRPTKKQTELLTFIDQFIAAHGYSPSYREIMQGLQYNSVATVSLHVNNLIKRGHLQKRDRSARSLEVVKGISADTQTKNSAKTAQNQRGQMADRKSRSIF